LCWYEEEEEGKSAIECALCLGYNRIRALRGTSRSKEVVIWLIITLIWRY